MTKPTTLLGIAMPPGLKIDPVLAVQESIIPDLPAIDTIACGIGTGDPEEQAASTATILNDHEIVALLLRKNFDDYDRATRDDSTADYLVTGLLQAQNRTLWMLRRYLP